MIGSKIKSARLLRGFTLEELAKKTGNITKQAISKYESGKSIPSKDVLLRIASALNTKISFFFADTSINITYGAYRKHKNLSKSDNDIIKATIEKELEKRIWLDSIIKTNKTLFSHPFKGKSINDVEDFAIQLRKDWKLGLDPIENVVNTIEDKGIYVIEIDTNNNFNGINGAVNNTGFIVINKNISRCRQRFDLLHELFHLITGLNEDKENELMAHRFASAFLVPRDMAYMELGQGRLNLNFNELKILKRKYGLSIQAWIRRALDLGIINRSSYQRLFIKINQLDWRKIEPLDDVLSKEEPLKFKLLIMRSVMENIIPISKAEELFPDIKKELIDSSEDSQDKVKPQDIMKMLFNKRKKYLESLNWNEVEKDYKEDPKLKEFSDFVGDDEL